MLLQSTKCVFKRCRLQGSTSESPFPASAPSSLCIPFMTKKRHPHPAAGTAFWEPAPPTPNGARALLLPLPQHLHMCTPLCMPQPLPSSGLLGPALSHLALPTHSSLRGQPELKKAPPPPGAWWGGPPGQPGARPQGGDPPGQSFGGHPVTPR